MMKEDNVLSKAHVLRFTRYRSYQLLVILGRNFLCVYKIRGVPPRIGASWSTSLQRYFNHALERILAQGPVVQKAISLIQD